MPPESKHTHLAMSYPPEQTSPSAPKASSVAGWTPVPEGRSTEIIRKNFKDELVHNVKYLDRKLFTMKFLPGKVTTLTSNEATVARIVNAVKADCHEEIALIEELSCAKSVSEVKFYPPMVRSYSVRHSR